MRRWLNMIATRQPARRIALDALFGAGLGLAAALITMLLVEPRVGGLTGTRRAVSPSGAVMQLDLGEFVQRTKGLRIEKGSLEDPGMAFVLVQHLAPDHKSILTELIRRTTRMPVTEIEDGMVIQANCVYVIPPNKDLSILHGVLHLLAPAAPRGLRLPIDFFFRSLAEDWRERSVGVVLSGMGTDGTLGLRAIKEQCGAVFAQDPKSAKYDSMVRSVIHEGLADVAKLPKLLGMNLPR